MGAIAGINQALWDVKGKHYGAPVYELLGGKSRDEIRVYQWVGGDRPRDVVQEAHQFVDAGYTALKLDATNQMRYIESQEKLDAVVDRITYVRDELDGAVDIGVPGSRVEVDGAHADPPPLGRRRDVR